jgi:hypothetical protein
MGVIRLWIEKVSQHRHNIEKVIKSLNGTSGKTRGMPLWRRIDEHPSLSEMALAAYVYSVACACRLYRTPSFFPALCRKRNLRTDVECNEGFCFPRIQRSRQ